VPRATRPQMPCRIAARRKTAKQRKFPRFGEIKLLLSKSRKGSRNVRLGDTRTTDQNVSLADHLRKVHNRVLCWRFAGRSKVLCRAQDRGVVLS
jgi:hypothetical protein